MIILLLFAFGIGITAIMIYSIKLIVESKYEIRRLERQKREEEFKKEEEEWRELFTFKYFEEND